MEIVVGRSNRRRTDLKAGNGNYTSVITVSDAQARESCDFTEPVFIMTRFNNYESCNYVYVSRWSRYYFINEITVNGNLIELHCVEDYLASWYSSIMSQSLFCTRSSSDPNLYLTDNVYPTESRTERRYYTFDSPFDARFSNNDGVYVLAVNGTPPVVKKGDGYVNSEVDAYIGMTNYYILPTETMSAFAAMLYHKDFLNSLKFEWEDPMDFIVKCYWLPLQLDDLSPYIQQSSNHFQICLGDTAIELSDVHSIFPQYTDNPTVYVWKSEWNEYPTIPSFGRTVDLYPTGDFFNTDYPFQNHAPYSHMYLYTMPDGLIEMGDNVITAFYEATKDDPIHMHYAFDITQGNLLLEIFDKNNHTIFERNMECSIEIQLTKLTYDVDGMLDGLGNIAGGAVLAGSGAKGSGAGGMVGGIAQTVNAALKTDVENTGNTRGNFNAFGIGDWFFMRTYNPVNLYTSSCGLPCCKTETLSNLSGYAQFDPVNIKTANGMLAKEQAEIETLLRRGVYINE